MIRSFQIFVEVILLNQLNNLQIAIYYLYYIYNNNNNNNNK